METKFSKEINDDIIESYHISESPYGIICLTITTSDRWVGYNKQSNTQYTVYQPYDRTTSELIIDGEAGEYLKNISRCVCTEQQEKDQICFYFIPIKLLKGDEYEIKIFRKNKSKRTKQCTKQQLK